MQTDFKYLITYTQDNEPRIVWYNDLTSAVAGYKDCVKKGMTKVVLAKIKPVEVEITIKVDDDE